MHDLVALNCGITFFVEVLTQSPCVSLCTEAYHVFDSPPGLELPWAAQMPMDAPISRVTMPPPVPGPALSSAPPGLCDAQNFSEAKRGISALAKEMIDWLAKMVFKSFGWFWYALVMNRNYLNNVLISATDISFSRLLPTFQYTLRLWGSNLDVSSYPREVAQPHAPMPPCIDDDEQTDCEASVPRHPKGSWPVLHEVPQIERVRHPAGHKVCSYMQARNGMLTDLHAHLAQLLSMPAYISNSSHILYCMWSSHSLICPFLHAVLHDKSKH